MTIEDFKTAKGILEKVKNLEDEVELVETQIINTKKELETHIPETKKILYMDKSCAPSYVVVNMEEWMALLEMTQARLHKELADLSNDFAKLGE